MAIINTRAYQAYNHLIDGFVRGNMSRGFEDETNKQFVHGAIGLSHVGADNPFTAGTREAFLYFRMKYCYGMWQRGGIDAKVNRIRMFRAAAELASMNLPNPFKFELEPVIEPSTETVSLEAWAEAEYNKAVAEDVASKTYVPVEEPVHIMGVLPVEEDE